MVVIRQSIWGDAVKRNTCATRCVDCFGIGFVCYVPSVVYLLSQMSLSFSLLNICDYIN